MITIIPRNGVFEIHSDGQKLGAFHSLLAAETYRDACNRGPAPSTDKPRWVEPRPLDKEVRGGTYVLSAALFVAVGLTLGVIKGCAEEISQPLPLPISRMNPEPRMAQLFASSSTESRRARTRRNGTGRVNPVQGLIVHGMLVIPGRTDPSQSSAWPARNSFPLGAQATYPTRSTISLMVPVLHGNYAPSFVL